MLAALGILALAELVGLLAAPVAGLLFARLPGAGVGFAKVLGLLLVTWLAWLAAALHLVPYGRGLIIAALVALGVAGVLAARHTRRPWGLGDPVGRRLIVGAEAVFAVAYPLGVLLASFAPAVWNTEKPMDMAFIDAINASSRFP